MKADRVKASLLSLRELVTAGTYCDPNTDEGIAILETLACALPLEKVLVLIDIALTTLTDPETVEKLNDLDKALATIPSN